jgi:hypothetical protein
MKHATIDERTKLYHILIANLKRCNLWDKVTVLEGGEYYQNFLTVKQYVEDYMINGAKGESNER